MNFLKTVLKNLKHTFLFWKPSNLKKMFVTTWNCIFLSAIIIWEIIEDIVFPILMMFLGDTLNPSVLHNCTSYMVFMPTPELVCRLSLGLISYFHTQ